MSEIRYEVVDHVALVTLDAVHRRNSLTTAMAAELVAAFDEADADHDVGAVVLSGQSAFCAGADLGSLREWVSDPAGDENFRAVESIYRAIVRVGDSLPPTVAAVRGAAVGAGINLALATDARVVASDARLISRYGRLGVHPGGGHFLSLARAAGREVSAVMGLFGREIDGNRAVELGMAWEATADAEVDARAFELARHIAQDPDLARRMAASFRRETATPGISWDVGVEVERSPQVWSFRRKDASGGPRAGADFRVPGSEAVPGA